MRSRNSTTVVFCLLLFAILSLITKAALHTNGFLSDFTANLDATIIGAIVGIPLGLWASSIAQSQAQRAEGRKFLEYVQKELEDNGRVSNKLLQMSLSKKTRKDHPAAKAAFTEFKTGFWRATLSGGKFSTIDDPKLVDALVLAYHFIDTLELLADALFRNSPLVALPKGAPGFRPEFDERWWNVVECTHPAVMEALRAVREHLGTPERHND